MIKEKYYVDDGSIEYLDEVFDSWSNYKALKSDLQQICELSGKKFQIYESTADFAFGEKALGIISDEPIHLCGKSLEILNHAIGLSQHILFFKHNQSYYIRFATDFSWLWLFE